MSWTNAQKGRVAAYRRYAGWSDEYYHARLAEHTGCRSSTHRRLKNADYEAFMPVVETAAHLAHINGCAVGRLPVRGTIDWYYWRHRQPTDGRASSRHLHSVWELLASITPRPADPLTYLRGILTQARGGDWPASGCLSDLLAWQCGLLIEALKDRANHASRRKEATHT